MSIWRPIAVLGCVVAFLPACVSTAPSAREERASNAAAATANVNLGAEYLRRGRAAVAVDVLERALEIDDGHADAHFTIALAYGALGELELAEQHHRRALRLDSANAAAQNGYAVFLCRQNRWSDAEPLFRQAADNPDYDTPAAALTNAGTCARNANDPESARKYFLEALRIFPEYPDALANMLDIAWQEAHYIEARSWLRRLLVDGSADAELLLLCVRIEGELADADAAERCAARLRDDYPDSTELAEMRESRHDAGN